MAAEMKMIVPSREAIEAALFCTPVTPDGDEKAMPIDFMGLGSPEKLELAYCVAHSMIQAALAAMLEPVAIVCMNGRRYGHGLFADIEVQFPETTTPPPTIGTQLYRIKP